MRSKTFEEYRQKWDDYSTKNRVTTPKFDPEAQKDIRKGFRSFLKMHRQFSSLERIHLKGRPISEKKQQLLIKNAVKSEQDFKMAVRISLKQFKKQKGILESHQQFIVDNFDDVAVFSNPIFFDKNLRAKLTEMGFSMKEMRFYHNVIFNSVTGKVFKQLFTEKPIYSILEQSLKNLERLPFPESLETMKKRGMITISGGEQAVPYIVGAAMIVVGVVATIYCPPVGTALVGSGASIIMEEAIQDISGTQDGYWSIGVNDLPDLVSFPISPSEDEQLVYFPWEPPPTAPPPPVEEPPPTLPIPPVEGPPISIPPTYTGTYYGNHSPSKMEVHRVHCSWLHLINPDNIQVHGSLDEAHSLGLDNCHYCIGGSTR